MALKVKFKKLDPNAKEPSKKYVGDAGYDLYAVNDILVPANVPTQVPTGISLKLPEGYYVEIHTRSGHGVKGMRNHLGIVDEGYHGEITVIMNSPTDFNVVKGDRIGQLVFRKRIGVKFIEVEEEFVSDRGAKGFGSTGA